MTKVTTGGVQADEVVLLGHTYLGEQTIAMTGASAPATLPPGTNFVEISASGGAVQASINGTASANSGMYIPEDQIRYIIKLDNLESLAFFGAEGATVHLIYKMEQ